MCVYVSLMTCVRVCVCTCAHAGAQGIELNPRVGEFDIKMFFIVRVGMMSWLFVNFSCMVAQYYRHGEVTNSMILINIMHGGLVLRVCLVVSPTHTHSHSHTLTLSSLTCPVPSLSHHLLPGPMPASTLSPTWQPRTALTCWPVRRGTWLPLTSYVSLCLWSRSVRCALLQC